MASILDSIADDMRRPAGPPRARPEPPVRPRVHMSFEDFITTEASVASLPMAQQAEHYGDYRHACVLEACGELLRQASSLKGRLEQSIRELDIFADSCRPQDRSPS